MEVTVPAGDAPGAADTGGGAPAPTKVSQRVERGEYVKLTQLQFNVPKPRKRTQDLCACECDPSSPCEDNDCLNRMMYMECSSASCPCGTKCRNRRFQTGRCVKTEKFDAGQKGFGLRVKQDVESGDFIGEYVGEVVDQDMLEERKLEYKRDGIRHHYFMNLESDLIIDATNKGAQTRFINHSCSPNAELQKWNVNGYFRVGFFAARSIAAGGEVTFDYQYDRGNDAQECYCGSEDCRGQIVAKKEVKSSGGSKRSSSGGRRLSPVEKDRRILYKLSNTAEGGIGSADSVIEMIQVMARNQDNSELRSEIMDIIENTDDEGKLNKFLQLRGLFFLRQWLEDRATGLKDQVFRILESLPIHTLNVLESAQITPVVEDYQRGTEEDKGLQAAAGNLLGKWSTLKKVYVIPKKREEQQEVTEDVHIPRNRLAEFQSSTLKLLGGECNVRAAFSRKNSLADSRALRVTGLRNSVDSIKEKIQEILQQEPPETPQREASSNADSGRRNSWRSSSGSPSSSSKRSRPMDGTEDGLSKLEEQDELKPGWQEAFDQEGAKYYWNKETLESAWDRPIVGVEKKRRVSLAEKPNRNMIAGLNPNAAREQDGKAKDHTAAKAKDEPNETEVKAKFRQQASKAVIKVLDRYRKSDCKFGKITNSGDFKHLARKITHHIVKKELAAAEDAKKPPSFDEDVKHKAKNFVKAYMKKLGPVYVRKPNEKD